MLSRPRQPVARLSERALKDIVLTCCWWLVLGALYFSVSKSAQGANGMSFTMPQMIPTPNGTPSPSFSTQSGLKIELDTTWSGKRGYRPFKIQASLAQPATADILITIRLHAGRWRERGRNIEVEYDFQLDAGEASTTEVISVPQIDHWDAWGWEVWVDGVADPQLKIESMSFNQGGNEGLSVGFVMGGRRRIPSGRLLLEISSRNIDSVNLGLLDLPTDWLDYSTLDLVVMSAEDFASASVSVPDAVEALLRWVRAGGNLWIAECGQDYAELPKVEQVIDPDSRTNAEEDESQLLSKWRFLPLDTGGRAGLSKLMRLTMQPTAESLELTPLEMLDSKIPGRALDSRHWFIARALGLGTVVALQVDTENREQLLEMTPVFERSGLMEYLRWEERHGNDPADGNLNFNYLLIPDVGAAPVLEFQLLISLFVIAIGPVNYWLLKRNNQLPLMLLTVPAAAILATLILFTYGFLADGVGTRVRARTFTMLDQVAGEVASWGRLSYYAGIAPGDGLQMPADTAVYPINPARQRYNGWGVNRSGQQRAMEWTAVQNLQRGWLASRTPTQYLTVTARPSEKQLSFNQRNEALQVTNSLGTDVLALAVQDHQGNIYLCESLGDNATASLQPTDYGKAAGRIRQYMTENLPQLPPGFVEDNSRRRNTYGQSMNTSLMEQHLEAVVSPNVEGWGNGQYVAITATGIETPLGLENIVESHSFHVLRGGW